MGMDRLSGEGLLDRGADRGYRLTCVGSRVDRAFSLARRSLMKSRSALVFLGFTVLTGTLVVGSSLGGCQSNGTGTGGAGGTGTTNSTGTNPNTTNSTGTTNPTTSTSGTGGGPQAVMATVKDVTTGTIGPKIPVELKGVVAM